MQYTYMLHNLPHSYIVNEAQKLNCLGKATPLHLRSDTFGKRI